MAKEENGAYSAENAASSTHAALAAAPPESQDQILLEKYRNLFTGTFDHTLDSKGRMVIPLSFRDTLGPTFSITPSFDFKSIAVYPELAYVRMRDKYQRAGKKKNVPQLQDYLQWLDAFTFRGQECDGQGRVLLPVKLRQMILGDDKDVAIMGAGDHLRIASRARSEDQFKSFMENLSGILSGIGAVDDED